MARESVRRPGGVAAGAVAVLRARRTTAPMRGAQSRATSLTVVTLEDARGRSLPAYSIKELRVSAIRDLSSHQWSAYLETMDGVSPTAEVPTQARAPLVSAFCEPTQWQGLIRWSRLRQRRSDY